MFFIFLLAFSPRYSLAVSLKDLNIQPERINPGNILYNVKRVWEKVQERVITNKDAKIRLYSSLVEQRLSELDYVVETKNRNQMEKTSSRLAYYAGTLEEFLENNASQETKLQVREKYKTYLEPLALMRDEFSANSSDWMFVQYDIDSLNNYIQKLGS